MKTTMPGFLYVLTHPSDPSLYKVGQTARDPHQRLAEHNSNYTKHAGKIVKETGQKWELKEYIAVPDPTWAEAVFWNATGLADIPYRYGLEVERMAWSTVQAGLKAAANSGVRPPPKPLPDYIHANSAWLRRRLAERGISFSGHVKSKMAGRNDFKCNNGHQWRTVPNNVAKGEGCPQCGMGTRTPEEIRSIAPSGVALLLTHDELPGLIRIVVAPMSIDECTAENVLGDWHVHRHRTVEDPALAETTIWDLIGRPLSHDREPFAMELSDAEQAFRELIYRIDSHIALAERVKIVVASQNIRD